MELLKDISAVLGLISALVAVLSIFSKGVRKVITKIFTNYESVKKKDIEELKTLIQEHIRLDEEYRASFDPAEINRLKELIEEHLKQDAEYKQEVAETIKQLQKQLEDQQELITKFAKTYCRDTLKNIYCKYSGQKILPSYVKSVVESINDFYVGTLNGNSYAKGLIEEMSKWEVDYLGSGLDNN